MEADQEAVHCRADRFEEGHNPNQLPQQQPVEETLEHPGAKIQGMLYFFLWQCGGDNVALTCDS